MFVFLKKNISALAVFVFCWTKSVFNCRHWVLVKPLQWNTNTAENGLLEPQRWLFQDEANDEGEAEAADFNFSIYSNLALKRSVFIFIKGFHFVLFT